MEQQYIYAVARIRTKELSLLNKQILEQLLACKTEKDCLRMLGEKGWGNTGEEAAEEMLELEREKTWSLLEELVEDPAVFSIFLYENDFHNIKAAIKQVYTGTPLKKLYFSHGTVPVETIQEAVEKHDFSILPVFLQTAAKEAYEIQFHTGDSQMCDVILDHAALEWIGYAAKQSKQPLFLQYAEQKIAFANIQIAIRGARMKKECSFFEKAMAPCDYLDIKELAKAACQGEKAVHAYLLTTKYQKAVEPLQKSFSAFEKWCDQQYMELIAPEKYHPFTIAPLAAYLLARENEIKSVRILLSGKRNQLSENFIRERLREMYV